MCLLLDHGLRCGEAKGLTIQSINLSNGILVFYREKVDKTQTHQLTRDTLMAAFRYFQVCIPSEKLLMGSRKGGTDIKSLQDAGGWNSPAMPLRYVESAIIANQGIKLG